VICLLVMCHVSSHWYIPYMHYVSPPQSSLPVSQYPQMVYRPPLAGVPYPILCLHPFDPQPFSYTGITPSADPPPL